MISDFISISALQGQLKKVFISKKPIHIVLSNNKVSGMVVSQEATKLLMESGVLEKLQEELWELHDKETVFVVRGSKEGPGTHSVSFNEWAKEV